MVSTRDLLLHPPRRPSRARCGRLAWVGPVRLRCRRRVPAAALLGLQTSWSLPALAQPATVAGAGHEGWLWPALLLGLLLLLVLLALACLLLLQRQRQLVQALAAGQAAPAALANEPADLAADEVVDVQALALAEAEAAASHEHESFSYTVSHDLRAPIRVVEGFTKILKEDYGRALDRIGNDHLDRVLGAAARMNSMIDALLALSQLSSQPLARQPVDLSQLAAYVAEDLRRQSPEREVLLQIEPEMQVTGDPTLLRVVIENLLGNAWKYTGKCPKAEIRFARHPRDRHTFTVADNGAGFDMRFADRLFGVFQRLHSASEYQGTGVGLASVRRIVRRHGGEIWAESEVNRGARFHFSVGR